MPPLTSEIPTTAGARRPKIYAPGEFAAALNERIEGVQFSERWVQKMCKRFLDSKGPKEKRPGIRTLGFFAGRYLITEDELNRVCSGARE